MFEFDYLNTPTEHANSDSRKKIVVIGGGIIGTCVVYYLTKHPKFDPEKYHIIILESTEVAGGASGKAGGLLASWAFPEEIVPLSFELHQQLSDLYNGSEEWGYRRINTLSLEATAVEEDAEDITDTKNTNSENSDEVSIDNAKEDDGIFMNLDQSGLPKDLQWIDRKKVKEWTSLGNTGSTAQVLPYKFTTFILNEALKSDSVDLIRGKLSNINLGDDGVVKSIDYIQTNPSLDGRGEIIDIDNIDKLVLAMGPWTSKILLDCPISALKAHSIILNPDSEERMAKFQEILKPYALFTDLELPNFQSFAPEIYARKEDLYICGEGDSLEELPDDLSKVEVNKQKCDELLHYAKKIVSPKIFEMTKKNIIQTAGYLPVLNVDTTSGPLIGETNVKNLLIAGGHSCWGINNAPVTGKLMAELIIDGEVTAANISSLDPSLYFDASILD
ncbi:hypothetical protein TPHA_0K00140 [Tetrapisispora phaffii CBS 4417]|uniref:FAD dependent oxidoreductase domain-containing protein n=1 Tax=Tetrapisispora phaffii (strain ATCC 24235 / CBS 4417 / NBRC 1672 / NRRL Y-8282 / UCD 70-5) TaxID=1071381 RepID=G8BZ20_TETPH|nr:hypothetical protein TPHA_0K00140 [Tetrapisispora phaffii CBS 4417]CCE65148.1 hypothetical protein TPHA_0K00140 [Tetrapisispora phaffii CBS 4417]